MPIIEHRTGDLFSATDVGGILQGCNTQGAMGKGIALRFKQYYPEMYKEYRILCANRKFLLGMIFPWQDPKTGMWVYNLATQEWTGACAKVEYIRESLSKAIKHAEEHNLKSLAMPLVGCGLGGLSWDKDVHPVVQEAASKTSVLLVIYQYRDVNKQT